MSIISQNDDKLQIDDSCVVCITKKFVSHDDRHLVNSSLRYVAFANDLGEGAKSYLPRWLYIGSYAATGGYAFLAIYGDFLNKKKDLVKTHNESNNKLDSITAIKNIKYELAREVADKSIWHAVASVAGTPLVIHQIKHLTEKIFKPKTPAMPAVVGLASIPVIVPPIDNGMTGIMNIFRKPENQQPYHWTGLWSFMNKH